MGLKARQNLTVQTERRTRDVTDKNHHRSSNEEAK